MFLLCAAATAYVLIWKPQQQLWLWYAAIGVTAALTLAALGRWAWLWMKINAIARDLAQHLRVVDRDAESFRESLRSANLNDLQPWGCRAAMMTIFAMRCLAGCSTWFDRSATELCSCWWIAWMSRR